MNWLELRLLNHYIKSLGKRYHMPIANIPPWLQNVLAVVINVGAVYVGSKWPDYLPSVMLLAGILGITINNNSLKTPVKPKV